MSFKTKMMDMMMGNMTFEEKESMMSQMMDKFFQNMPSEDKSKLMQNMMSQMMGGEMPMMGMFSGSTCNESSEMNNTMQQMMQKMMSGNSQMMEMCKMMCNFSSKESSDTIKITPEIKSLFEDWVNQVENEISNVFKDKSDINSKDISASLGISEESANYFFRKIRDKKAYNNNCNEST